ncbi:MAG: phosphoenolpyruvate-utilizing N-terminal domain-containing protein, partial [bacterium]
MRAAMVQLKGTPAAPGLAAGPLVRIAAAQRPTRKRGAPAAERESLAAAISVAREHLLSLAEKAGSASEEGIVAFQLALLEDEEFTHAAFQAIAAGEPVEVAWELALDAQIADYESSQDAYFRGRAADLADLRDRVLDELLGGERESIPPGAIVFAEDLAPSRFLATDWHSGGLVLNRGGTTSHVAILARARGVPMLVGIDLAGLDKHAEALLDAQTGVLILD